MSYSYYLIHGLTLKATFLLASKIMISNTQLTYGFWFVLPVFFIITLIPAFILFINIERPFSLATAK